MFLSAVKQLKNIISINKQMKKKKKKESKLII